MAKKDNCTCCGDCIYYIRTNEKYGCCSYPPDGLGLKDRLISDYCSRAVAVTGNVWDDPELMEATNNG